MSIYILTWGDEHYTIEADWGQAADTVLWCGESTQYQVADVRHEWTAAARRLLREEARDGGLDPDDPEIAAEIDRVIDAAVWTDPIETTYEDCQGGWAGVDWTCPHGPWEVDLDGKDADELRAIADRVAAGEETEEDRQHLPERVWSGDRADIVDWLRDAADYLDDVAASATSAEEAGEEAIEAVRQGDLDAALEHAERACRIERQYGDCPVWGTLRSAIEQAIEDRDEADV